MITKRTLENYRTMALKYQNHSSVNTVKNQSPESLVDDIQRLTRMVLETTRELIDQHLLRK